MIREFESIILARAPHFQVAIDAPDTWEKMQSSFARNGFIIVWNGGSNQTIYSTPYINWSFRAWHDFQHLAHGLDFSMRGESLVCEYQLRDFYRATTSRALRRFGSAILECEIIAQAEHYFKHGEFVRDQKAFTRRLALRR